MKNKNAIMVGLIAVLVIGAGIFFFTKAGSRKKQEGEDEGGKPDSEPTKSPEAETPSTPPAMPKNIQDYLSTHKFKYPMKYGSKGESVKQLQKLLISYNKKLIPAGATGNFLSQTENAVKKVIGKKSVDSEKDIIAIWERGNAIAQMILSNPAILIRK